MFRLLQNHLFSAHSAHAPVCNGVFLDLQILDHFMKYFSDFSQTGIFFESLTFSMSWQINTDKLKMMLPGLEGLILNGGS